MNEYEKQALDFCKKYGVEITLTYLGKQKREEVFGDDIARDTYSVDIIRNGNKFSLLFSDSIFNTEKNEESRRGRRKVWNQVLKVQTPTAYDILAVLTKYAPGDFDDFLRDYGYQITNHREYLKLNCLYLRVKDEYASVYKMFSDCMDELSEIW